MILPPRVSPPTSTRQGKKLVLPFGAVKVAGAYLWRSACQRCLRASPIRRNWLFLRVMAVGSVLGTFVGGLLLGLAPTTFYYRCSACFFCSGREGVAALVGRADCPRCPSSEDLLTMLVPAGHLSGACAARHRERARLALLGRVTGWRRSATSRTASANRTSDRQPVAVSALIRMSKLL